MINKFIQRHFTGTLYLNAPPAINTAIGLVTLPIILAALSTTDYGKWQFVLAIQLWVTAITIGQLHVMIPV